MSFLEKRIALLFFIASAALIILSFLSHWDHLITTQLAYDNSDVLYPEHYARDILSGASIWDWWNLQAPYFFPDIFLQFILVAIGFGKHEASVNYSLVSVLLFFGAWSFAATRIGLSQWKLCAAIALTGLISLLCLTGTTDPQSWAHTLVYVHLCGHHGGYALGLAVMAWLSVRLLRGKDKRVIAAYTMLSALFFLSDMLYGIAFAGPVTLWLAYLWYRGALEKSAIIRWFLPTLAGLALSRVFGHLTPYQNTSEYFKGIMNIWPDHVPVTLAAFSTHAKDYYFTTGGSAGLIGIATVISVAFLAYWLCRQPKSAPLNDQTLMAQLLAVIAAVGFIGVLSVQLGLGIYEHLPHSRHFSALVAILPIVAFMLWVRDARTPANSIFFAIISVLGLIALLWPLHYNAQQPSVSRSRPQLAACYAKLAQEHHITGIMTDYWMTRPLIFASNNAIQITSFDSTEIQPIFNGHNVKKSKGNKLNAVLVWDAKSTSETIKYFGKPEQILSCAGVEGVANGEFALYKYSDENRLNIWVEQNERVDVKEFPLTVPAARLFHKTDYTAIHGSEIKLAPGTTTYGRLILVLTPGEYTLQINFASPTQATLDCKFNHKKLEPSGALNNARQVTFEATVPKKRFPRKRQRFECELTAESPVHIQSFIVNTQSGK